MEKLALLVRSFVESNPRDAAHAFEQLEGAAIPLVLKALNRDPAQSSSIFLTTVTYCVGFASFLGFAVIFMPLLL